MDQPQYTKVMALVADLPDPRKPRGKQIAWTVLWGVICAAMLSQQRTPAAIAQWAQRQAHALVAAFQPARGRVPSESTIRRALQRVDVAALERREPTCGSCRRRPCCLLADRDRSKEALRAAKQAPLCLDRTTTVQAWCGARPSIRRLRLARP